MSVASVVSMVSVTSDPCWLCWLKCNAWAAGGVCVWCVREGTVHSVTGGSQQEWHAEATELPRRSYTGNSER